MDNILKAVSIESVINEAKNKGIEIITSYQFPELQIRASKDAPDGSIMYSSFSTQFYELYANNNLEANVIAIINEVIFKLEEFEKGHGVK